MKLQMKQILTAALFALAMLTVAPAFAANDVMTPVNDEVQSCNAVDQLQQTQRECNTDLDCFMKERCIGGRCHYDPSYCRYDADCDWRERCEFDRCRFDPNKCRSDWDCGPGRKCLGSRCN